MIFDFYDSAQPLLPATPPKKAAWLFIVNDGKTSCNPKTRPNEAAACGGGGGGRAAMPAHHDDCVLRELLLS